VFKFYRGVVAPPGLSPEVIAYYEDMVKKLNDSKAWKELYLAKYMLSPAGKGARNSPRHSRQRGGLRGDPEEPRLIK